MWWPMIPDCECVATIAPPVLAAMRSTSSARSNGVQVLAGLRFGGVQVGHTEPGSVTSALGTNCL